MQPVLPDPPRVPPGTVLSLDPSDWAYGSTAPGMFHLFVRVENVRRELARYYDNKRVWVEGVRVSDDGSPIAPVSLLVEVSALTKTVWPENGL